MSDLRSGVGAFLLAMKSIIKQISALKKSSKHTRKLSKLKREFLEYYTKLPIQKLAAEFIGKSQDAICDWKNNDKNFANQIASAKSAWALEKASKIRRPEWLLERIMKDHFAQKVETEHSLNSELEKALDRMAQILPR